MTPEAASRLTDDISSRLGYLDVVVASSTAPLPWSCQEVLHEQERGGDPTGEWRAQVGARQFAYYGVPAPPSVASAFVFQWYLGVIALPLAYASTAGPWVVDGSPEALRFDLSGDEWFPCAVSVVPGRIRAVAPPATTSRETSRVAARETARETAQEMAQEMAQHEYAVHARRFAESYRTEVKMGSHQREGMVLDAWRMAVESATAAYTRERVEPARRQSCCFIFALAGAQACAVCPRLRTAP